LPRKFKFLATFTHNYLFTQLYAVHKEENEVETEDENQNLDSARSSFSQALKGIQYSKY